MRAEFTFNCPSKAKLVHGVFVTSWIVVPGKTNKLVRGITLLRSVGSPFFLLPLLKSQEKRFYVRVREGNFSFIGDGDFEFLPFGPRIDTSTGDPQETLATSGKI